MYRKNEKDVRSQNSKKNNLEMTMDADGKKGRELN